MEINSTDVQHVIITFYRTSERCNDATLVIFADSVCWSFRLDENRRA